MGRPNSDRHCWDSINESTKENYYPIILFRTTTPRTKSTFSPLVTSQRSYAAKRMSNNGTVFLIGWTGFRYAREITNQLPQSAREAARALWLLRGISSVFSATQEQLARLGFNAQLCACCLLYHCDSAIWLTWKETLVSVETKETTEHLTR